MEHFSFFQILGISSSRVTNSMIFQRGRSTTKQLNSGYLTSPWKPWPIEIDDFPSYKPPFIMDFPWLWLVHDLGNPYVP